MFVFLSKFLPLFVYPLGISFVLVVLALVMHQQARLRTVLLTLAVIILYVSSNRWVSYALARSLEWRYLPPRSVPQAEAIVVLGGATEPAQYPRPGVEVNSAGDRVLYAAKLYKEGRAPVILLSGGNITWLSGRSMTPADEMADLLEMIGIPKEDLILQPDSRNTYEDALFSSRILKERGIKRILLVTSAMHMPRSVALFQHQGIDVIPTPADYTITQDGWDTLNSFDPQGTLVNLLPNTSSLSLTTNVMKEYIGLLIYGLRGWL